MHGKGMLDCCVSDTIGNPCFTCVSNNTKWMSVVLSCVVGHPSREMFDAMNHQRMSRDRVLASEWRHSATPAASSSSSIIDCYDSIDSRRSKGASRPQRVCVSRRPGPFSRNTSIDEGETMYVCRQSTPASSFHVFIKI